jgi:two-component system sensor histidine kinase UhpB
MEKKSNAQSTQLISGQQPLDPSAFSRKKIGLTNPRQLFPKREWIAWDLLDAIADVVILVNLQGTILWVNNSASKKLDKPIETLINTSIWDVYPPQKVNHHKILFNEVAKTGRSLSFIDKSEDRWVEMMIYPIKNINGQLSEIAFQERDITAQIEAEEMVKRLSVQFITVQEDERRRISQDLHDEIGQQMTALLLELRSIQNTIRTNDETIADQITGAIRNLESIMKGLRQVFYQLYPPSLHHTTLTKVLSAHCSSFARSTGIKVDFSCPNDFPALSNIYEVTLYRFVQEGLANAAKHGRARSVWINLDVSDDEINISLEDDGLGFDPNKLLLGLGLRGIQERFLMLRGCFDIESAPGKGTKLFGALHMKTIET